MSIAKTLSVLFFSALTLAVSALDVKDISTGDVLYTYGGLFGSNEQVIVVDIDRSASRVKVRRASDYSTEWYSTSDLYSKTAVDKKGTSEGIGAAVIGIGIIFCLANPEKCK